MLVLEQSLQNPITFPSLYVALIRRTVRCNTFANGDAYTDTGDYFEHDKPMGLQPACSYRW